MRKITEKRPRLQSIDLSKLKTYPLGRRHSKVQVSDFSVAWRSPFLLGAVRRLVKNALVMIVDRNGQGAFCVVLANAMEIEVTFDLGRLRYLLDRGGFFRFGGEFLIEHVFAQHNAVVANVNAGTGDQLFDFGVRFAAKAAKGEISRASHESLGWELG